MKRDVRLFKVWRACFPHHKSIGFTLARQSAHPSTHSLRLWLPLRIVSYYMSYNCIFFSSNTLSHNIRKNGKKKRYWRTWISQERWHEHYNLMRFDNSSDFTQICLRLQGFPIRKVSTIKETSIWQQRFSRILVQEFSTVPDVTHSTTSQDKKLRYGMWGEGKGKHSAFKVALTLTLLAPQVDGRHSVFQASGSSESYRNVSS